MKKRFVKNYKYHGERGSLVIITREEFDSLREETAIENFAQKYLLKGYRLIEGTFDSAYIKMFLSN